MASKQITNRLYWVACKAYIDRPDDFSSLAIRRAYVAAVAGTKTDFALMPILARYEAMYGGHKVHQDLNNANLWPARDIMDKARELATVDYNAARAPRIDPLTVTA